ncbi:MAG: structural cement protein Gp24 [Planctomycetota bacterium]|jgi:hypothetical protein
MALQTSVDTQRKLGIAGMPADSGTARVSLFKSFANAQDVATQQNTVTIDTGAVAVYSVLVDGVEVTFDSQDTVTDTIAAGLAAALSSEPLVNASVEVEVSGSVLTLTSRVSSEPFTVSLGQSAANMTLAEVTANGEGSLIPFGRALVKVSDTEAKLVNDTDIASEADATKKIIGIAVYNVNEPIECGSDDRGYLPKAAMVVGDDEDFLVEVEAQPALYDDVYVRVAADGSLDKIGGFAPAAGAGLVKWTEARWVASGRDGLANLKIRGL